MWGTLKSIFGASTTIEKGFDLIDSMHTSEKESIEAKVKGKVALLNSYSAFKLAQRVLAFMFAFTFLGCFWLAVVMVLVYARDIKDLLDVLDTFYIGPIMFTIITFYFGGGFLEGAIEKYKKSSDGLTDK